jgi:CHASE2 domain-containing sensor protein
MDKKLLLKNLALSIFLAILLHWSDLKFMRQWEDYAIDWVMAMQRGVSPVRPPIRSSIPLTFLDIDEATYRNWGEPLLTPRNKLLDIINFAVSRDPALVVVDVDLSRYGQCPEHDCCLGKFLNEYRGQDKPPIILPQVFREPIEGESMRIPRQPFFKKKNFNEADAGIFLASPLFELDESDFHLRHWRLWEVASNQEVVPSVELLALALFKPHSSNPGAVFHDMKRKIRLLTQVEEAPEPQHSRNSMTVKIAGVEFTNHAEDLNQRILYTIPGTLRPGESYPDNFIRRSALLIAKNDPADTNYKPADQCPIQCIPSNKAASTNHLPLNWLKGRVVIIGASFKESRDIYATPMGQMPGAMVIANAINSLYEHGQIEKPGIGWIIFIEIILVIIMTIAFTYAELKGKPILGTLVSGIVVIVIMLPLSFYLFKYGVWVYFALPLFAVLLHTVLCELKKTE